jgi:Asp-tRNA(Asn)/Glu-tRNA(Gln) amidotransferase A subunit family amidase
VSSAQDSWATAAAFRAGTLRAQDAVAAALDRIEQGDSDINAFTVLLPDRARAEAARLDADRAAGVPLGPLAGVPISVKDHVWLAGAPATNGSRALADFVPDQDCACVDRLRAAGAIVVGKTNNPEFCYRGTTSNDLYGTTRNPHDLTRTSGGSSGGAASSVAAGMVPLAIGTDGGGSIRIPSAFCGTYGLKPTFGLIPKMPGFRGWPTLSVTGPIAASVRDLALALTVMAGPSAADALSYPRPAADYLTAVTDATWVGLRVAVSVDLGHGAVDADVRASFRTAIDAISNAGAQLTEACPEPADPSPLWDSIALPEGNASEGPVLERWPQLVGADAAELIRAGAATTARQYLDAQDERARYSARWARFFDHYDVLLTPTMPTTAFPIDRLAPASIDGHAVPDGFDAWCELALPANLAGLPAASVPIGPGADGLPVGLQVMGPRWADATVLRAAAAAAR